VTTYMKTTLILFTVLAALHAPAQESNLAGHYVLQGVREVGSELELKPDGTFEYMLAYGAADYWAKGTWRLEGNAVILHSAAKEEEPFRLLKSDDGKSGRIRVWVMGKNGHGVANIRVGLLSADQQHLEATTDSEGAAVFPDTSKPKSVDFEVRVYSLRAGPYDVDPAHRDFYFEINGDTITQTFFKDEPLAIEGKVLLMKHGDPPEPMRYVKE
jgi:hypothetical protein